MEEQNNQSHFDNGANFGDEKHAEKSSESNSAMVRRRLGVQRPWSLGEEANDMLGPVSPMKTQLESDPKPSFWRTLRYKWTILLITIAIAVPGIAGVWLLVQPLYRAAGQIRVRPIIPHLVFRTEDNGMIPYYKGYLNTQVSVILSPTVLQRVLKRARRRTCLR